MKSGKILKLHKMAFFSSYGWKYKLNIKPCDDDSKYPLQLNLHNYYRRENTLLGMWCCRDLLSTMDYFSAAFLYFLEEWHDDDLDFLWL